MPAITFNGIRDAKYGTADLSRVYLGSAMVWSQDIGLPYNTAFPPPVGNTGAVSGAWTITQGPIASGTTGGMAGIVSTNVATAVHNTIYARNVRLTARGTVAGTANQYLALHARVNGNNYYSGEYTGLQLRIMAVLDGTRYELDSWGVSLANTSSFSFEVNGEQLTISRGAITHTILDNIFRDAGNVGFGFTNGEGLNTFSAVKP